MTIEQKYRAEIQKISTAVARKALDQATEDGVPEDADEYAADILESLKKISLRGGHPVLLRKLIPMLDLWLTEDVDFDDETGRAWDLFVKYLEQAFEDIEEALPF